MKLNLVRGIILSTSAFVLCVVSNPVFASTTSSMSQNQSAATTLQTNLSHAIETAAVSGSDPRPKGTIVAAVSGSDPRPKGTIVAAVSGSDPRPKGTIVAVSLS